MTLVKQERKRAVLAVALRYLVFAVIALAATAVAGVWLDAGAALEPVHALPAAPPRFGIGTMLGALTVLVTVFLGLLLLVSWRERRAPYPPRRRHLRRTT